MIRRVSMYTITDRTNTRAIGAADSLSYREFRGDLMRFQSVPGAARRSAPGCSFVALRANREGTWNRRLRRADCRFATLGQIQET